MNSRHHFDAVTGWAAAQADDGHVLIKCNVLYPTNGHSLDRQEAFTCYCTSPWSYATRLLGDRA